MHHTCPTFGALVGFEAKDPGTNSDAPAFSFGALELILSFSLIV